MRLRGIHAQAPLTLEVAMAKMASGTLTAAEGATLQLDVVTRGLKGGSMGMLPRVSSLPSPVLASMAATAVVPLLPSVVATKDEVPHVEVFTSKPEGESAL